LSGANFFSSKTALLFGLLTRLSPLTMELPQGNSDRAIMPESSRSDSRGHSLIELVYAFVILGALAVIAANPLLQARDQSAVRNAATVLVAEIARTRELAQLHGGARLSIDLANARVRVLGRDAALTEWQRLVSDAGVLVSAGSRRDSIQLEFDARGLGRLANASLEFQRGAARAGVVVSAYGRARQW
jgi:Tfp pilus assembly protein FimT